MKENRIIAFIGVYGCMILANTSEKIYFAWFWGALAIYWLYRYVYLCAKK